MLETGKLLTTSRRNNRPYAVLRASHNYLESDFLNLVRRKTPAMADLAIEREFSGNDKSASSSSDHRDVGICLPRTRQRLTRPCGGKSRPRKGECHERTSDDDFGKCSACRQPSCH